jgi:glycosyltransferase involved in cell wall biosynthesis
MRIAIVAPPWLPVPPPAYGGTETVLDVLARGLKSAGHDVLLCTTGDSTCAVERTSVFPRSLGVGIGGSVAEIRHVLYSYAQAAGVDLVHDHTLVGPIYAASAPELAVVTTNHGPFSEDVLDLYRAIAPRVPVIAISQHQASTASGVPIAATIHHGVDLDGFPVGNGSGEYALFLGRMFAGKGVDLAARLAREADMPLVIAGKMREESEIEYFEAKVKPLLDDDIVYVGEVDHATKLELLGNARCLLNPIIWPEPFGMVMIEALACGTPVVTTGFGAAPEIVEDGVVGFVCNTEPELLEALARVDAIDRGRCRSIVEERFSAERMVRDHLSLYESVLDARQRPLRAISA